MRIGDEFRWPVPTSSTSLWHEILHQNSEVVLVTNGRDQSLENLAEEHSSATAPPASFHPKSTTLSIHEVVDQISHQRAQNQNPRASAVMSKSESQSALEKLVEELSADATSQVPKKPTSSSIAEDDNEDILVENPYNKHAQASRLDVYSMLRAKLDMACAAAAVRFGEGSAGNECEDQPQAEQDSELGSQSPESDNDGMQKKRKVQIRKKTCASTSSVVDSETNEGELDDQAKRLRRLELNRKSARSYRRRKQGQINELQTEVDQLMEEHASMASEFADVQKKHEDAVMENQKLKAEIETLKARVNITEEKVERLMQLDPMLILNSRRNDIDSRVNDVSMEHSSSDHFIYQQPGLDAPRPAAASLHRLANIYFLDNDITAKRPQIADVTARTISTSNNISQDIAGNAIPVFKKGNHFLG